MSDSNTLENMCVIFQKCSLSGRVVQEVTLLHKVDVTLAHRALHL